jgi:hypothetical protein
MGDSRLRSGFDEIFNAVYVTPDWQAVGLVQGVNLNRQAINKIKQPH